ncbi:DUF1343 domain-containing protein [bacterium SCSIO 12741]|nr:DUF1343 domain-containing protein [bacterium SCSIO 12741]
MRRIIGLIVVSLNLIFCSQAVAQVPYKTVQTVVVGAEQFTQYSDLLEEARVAVVANHSSYVGEVHLVDFLLEQEVELVKVFSPEHGFRGTADAGEMVKNKKDPTTGVRIVSLYGSQKKPTFDHLADVDVVIFDIQDVGVRYYTYISTMHYVMQACAEMDKAFIVLDRPNPNGFYVDGPVLQEKFSSFVGIHPIPLVHGLTVGELAQMINGEGWLGEDLKCDLTVIPCINYDHNDYYKLPIKPSPNLPNMASIYLYPSLGLFEGTVVSVGRGTEKPFQMIGHPEIGTGDIQFTPESGPGAKYPKLMGEECKGYDLVNFGLNDMPKRKSLYLFWVINLKKEIEGPYFLENHFFDLLAGTDELRNQIMEGKKEDEIRQSWQPELDAFKEIRKKYLLYEDFE